MSEALDSILSRLGGVREEEPGHYRATCPWCGTPESLSLNDRDFRCRKGECDTVGTLDALSAKLEDDPPIYRTLAELLERPELLQPPECVLSRVAYRGRGVLFCGPDKSGKSTLFAHAARALTRGHSWLGEPTVQGRVVWCGLEEALGDAVRRFHELDADPDRIQLVTLAPNDLLAQTDSLLDVWPTDLLIVDSLHEYARVTYGETPGDGDNALWSVITRPVVQLARKHDVALVLLHHVRRSDGEARGASEILAAVDATLTMYAPKAGEDPTLRRVRGRGRWTIEPFSLALRDGQYQLAGGGELSIDTLVLLYVEAHPGASKRSVRQGVAGRASAVDASIHRHLERGTLEDRGKGDRMALYAGSGQGTLEMAS